MKPSAPFGEQSHEQLVETHFPVVQYHFVEMLTAHLADCSRAFDGDLQQMLLLALIGQVHIEHYRRHGGDVSDVRGLSASRLADVSGIPRQTVRRKLSLLAARGWIEETVPGSWRLKMEHGSAKAKTDLGALNDRNKQRMAKLIAAIAPLIAHH